MPLRHGSGSPPPWLAACAGPLLVIVSVLSAAAIAFDGPVTFVDAVKLALTLVLAAAGVALTVATFFGRK